MTGPQFHATMRARWHPGYVAERYGLFVIILLGESVAAATAATQKALASAGVTPALTTVLVRREVSPALLSNVLLFAFALFVAVTRSPGSPASRPGARL